MYPCTCLLKFKVFWGKEKGKEKKFSSGLFMSDSDMMKQELILCDELVTDN